jgi:hypothetical protein
MNKNLLEDFEKGEYYKNAYEQGKRKCIFFCILTFLLGFAVARAYYLIIL